jgi:predicted ester cyclase
MNTRVPDAVVQSALWPNDPEIDLDPAKLSPRKETIRRFYKRIWDEGEISLIPELLYENFTFRGSLGPVLVGYAQFAEYVRWVTATFDDYTSDILALVEEGDQVVGKLRFHGRQRKPLFGRSPRGDHVWWDGTAIFRFDGARVRELWVLGDIYGLLGRLDGCPSQIAEFTLGSMGP